MEIDVVTVTVRWWSGRRISRLFVGPLPTTLAAIADAMERHADRNTGDSSAGDFCRLVRAAAERNELIHEDACGIRYVFDSGFGPVELEMRDWVSLSPDTLGVSPASILEG